MIPGSTAYGALATASAPAAFKGVATYTVGGSLQVFQDTGTGYTEVFSITDGNIRDIQLGGNDLVVRRSAFPFLRVYSWNGTTFAQTWEMSPTLFGNSVPSSVSISYDGNRIEYGALGGIAPYGNTGVGILTRQSNGSYAQEAYVETGLQPASVATSDDGLVFFANRGNNNTAGFARNTGGTSWSSFAGTGSAPYGDSQPSAISRVRNNTNNMLYAATLSTSSPYIVIYRIVTTTGAMLRLSNPSVIPPSSYALSCCDVAYDGGYVACGYQAGTTANGNVIIYTKSTDAAFNGTNFNPGAETNGRIVGVSFNKEATKLFAARAFTGSTNERVWVYTRSGSTWSRTDYIQTSSYFLPTTNARRLISAN